MTFKLYITPVPLSFIITPNKALGIGVILTVLQTFADGDQMIVEEIPHHNRASAEFTKRQIIAANR